MANNPYVNKVQLADGTSLIDISSDTVTADKLMQGYTAHDRTGALITGTATGGGSGGNVWQDAQGYVHLDDEGTPPITVEPLSVTQNGTYTATAGHAYSPVTVSVSGGGGLVYEAGTWSPSEDTTRGTVSFSNTHTLPPVMIMMTDCTGTDTGTGSILGFSYIDHYRQAGHLLPSRSSSGTRCGYVAHMYRSSDSGTSSGTQILTSSSDSGSDTSGTQSNYYVSSSGFHPCVNNSSRYFRAGRTYKWIAVWAPTT